MVSQHVRELTSLYERTTNIYDKNEIKATVERIIDLQNPNIRDGILAKGNRKIKEAVGVDMAYHYVIAGKRGEEKSIQINRDLVRIKED